MYKLYISNLTRAKFIIHSYKQYRKRYNKPVAAIINTTGNDATDRRHRMRVCAEELIEFNGILDVEYWVQDDTALLFKTEADAMIFKLRFC